MANVALIIAGGIGNRMGQNIPKQFLTVNEKPVSSIASAHGMLVIAFPNFCVVSIHSVIIFSDTNGRIASCIKTISSLEKYFSSSKTPFRIDS